MKKFIYLLLALLTAIPSMATQNANTSLIIASTLVLSRAISKQNFSKRRSLALHKAIEQGDYASVETLIDNPKVDVNAKADYYIDVNKDYIIYGNTPLMMCCRQGGDTSLKMAKLLLERKDIKVNLENKWGETPLMKCCIAGDNNSLKMAEVLLKRDDINVNVWDKYGDTPLDTIVFFMMENKANYTYVNLWNVLIAKGGILNKRKEAYENLKPSDFKEAERSYVNLIKQNRPKNCKKNKLMDDEEENKEDE